MNKREFVLAGGGALLGGSGWAAAAAPAATAPVALAPAEGLAGWQQRVGEAFGLAGGSAAPLVLQRVDVHASDDISAQFTLIFSAAGTLASRSGTQVLRGADGRLLALYLDPAGRSAAGQPLLRADCNLLV